MPTTPPHQQPFWWSHAPWESEPSLRLPEDAEASDARFLQEEIDKLFDRMYPSFDPEVITSISGKEYYLPALKVLKRVDGVYYSPQKEAKWENMELDAECKDNGVYGSVTAKAVLDPTTKQVVNITFEPEEIIRTPKHPAPDESCDCGIYGSVNLEEVWEYIERCKRMDREARSYVTYNNQYADLPDWFQREYKDHYNPKTNFAVCVIEPSPDAKVILCRKGWKASKAFISEIVGETMSEYEASQLLSIAWQRPIDIRSLYESR